MTKLISKIKIKIRNWSIKYKKSLSFLSKIIFDGFTKQLLSKFSGLKLLVIRFKIILINFFYLKYHI